MAGSGYDFSLTAPGGYDMFIGEVVSKSKSGVRFKYKKRRSSKMLEEFFHKDRIIGLFEDPSKESDDYIYLTAESVECDDSSCVIEDGEEPSPSEVSGLLKVKDDTGYLVHFNSRGSMLQEVDGSKKSKKTKGVIKGAKDKKLKKVKGKKGDDEWGDE